MRFPALIAVLLAGCVFDVPPLDGPASDGAPVQPDLAADAAAPDLASPPSCTDGVRDGDESDVDCGGATCLLCLVGKACRKGTDCATGVCDGGKCASASCTDGLKNGDETDVDCGGMKCAPCAVGKGCGRGGDCQSGLCVGGLCTSATCGDDVKNGAETDVDCGGGTCPPCPPGKGCVQPSDCTSAVCTAGLCATASCNDGVTNGTETDVDCGGGGCPHCATGKSCQGAGDCTSGVCTGGKCSAPACNDGVKNGAETDVDCGGGCPACAPGKKCAQPSDCTSGVCTGGACAAPSCKDGIKNGAETDVDCGGGTCPGCAPGKACAAMGDCAADEHCAAMACACNAGFFGAPCALPRSCNDLLAKAPKTPSGLAVIDPDGAGPQPRMTVYCEMAKAGGGWTRLVKHVAAGGFFADDAAGRSSNTNDPENDLYSILGLVDAFKQQNGSYEFLYWNRQYDQYVVSKQTWSPLDAGKAGTCPPGNTIESSSYNVQLFCGYTTGPAMKTVINGNGMNWTHAVGQLKAYANFPLVCTYNTGFACNWIEFYVR